MKLFTNILHFFLTAYMNVLDICHQHIWNRACQCTSVV